MDDNVITFTGRLVAKVKEFGFIKNEDEPYFYKKVSGSALVFLMLYLDGILPIENDVLSLQSVKNWLGMCFSMKDLGEVLQRKLKRKEGSGLPIGSPNPESTWNLRLNPVDSRLGSSISDPDLSTEVASGLCGYQRPRWRGQGRRLAAPTPPLRSPTSSVGTGDLGRGVGVTDWQPRPLFRFQFSL
ncbi:hypothetical protein CRG98_015542 [Punica granatum]|uniref:Reverse transcriptase Ty1/copia-type domain-containing protein n=1 Tax=Punica granatum TaxID=22663 RepID=A0A2I0K6C9_PUNGR|nr:hypothetical protein CRG98_015542 [Punica granatum]